MCREQVFVLFRIYPAGLTRCIGPIRPVIGPLSPVTIYICICSCSILLTYSLIIMLGRGNKLLIVFVVNACFIGTIFGDKILQFYCYGVCQCFAN